MLIFTGVCLWIFPWLTALYIGSYSVPLVFIIVACCSGWAEPVDRDCIVCSCDGALIPDLS